MADVPELGQLKIIPDYWGWTIGQGSSLEKGDVSGSAVIIGGSLYDLINHRPSSKLQLHTAGETGEHYIYTSWGQKTGQWWGFLDGHNMKTDADAQICFEDSSHNKEQTLTVFNGTNSNPYVQPNANSLTVFKSASPSVAIRGINFTDISTFGSSHLSIGVIHIGMEYSMPHNATASLSYNTKFQNKVNTAFGGASYSTLYNTKPQRIISASWEYVNWSTGSSGIDDFTEMIGFSYGSHIPVALILDPDVTNTADNYLFARITKWQQTQQSPNLWKVSAEFTEFI